MKKILMMVFLGLIFVMTPQVNAQAGSIDFGVENYTSLNEMEQITNVVIFIKFADETSYNAPFDLSHYDDLFNAVGSMSLRDYYLEVSYGELEINSIIVANGTEILFYQDIYDRAYYQSYDSVTNPIGYLDNDTDVSEREHGLLKRAIDYVEDQDLIDDNIVLDFNDDGEIDSLSFLISNEDNGWNDLLWPHKWELSTYYDYYNSDYTADAPMINGKYAYTYTFELLGSSTNYDNQVDVPVLVHETFHLLSAPDLYHYFRYDYIDTIGYWGTMSILDSIPSHMLGYMKQAYGSWISSANEITSSGTYTIYPMIDSKDNLYRINTGYSNEFVYLEYRTQTGIYDSDLPHSGLLVYRVDFDYAGLGNEVGYYDENGFPADELFIFRPGIIDTVEPITFPNNPNNYDYDGFIDDAALSQFNTYNSAGKNTSIPLFYSDGTYMDIQISNVIEHDGYVTVDILLPPSLELEYSELLEAGTDIVLFDNEAMGYEVTLLNFQPYMAYYTLDGSVPNQSDTLYTGPIEIDAQNNTVSVAVYNGNTLVTTLLKTYEFSNVVETAHDDYGDLLNITWVLTPSEYVTDFSMVFSSNSFFEVDYDYVYITQQGVTTAYTAGELANVIIDGTDSVILVQLVTDNYVSDFYGFSTVITTEGYPSLNLNGSSEIIVEQNSDYTELGALITSSNQNFRYETIGEVDASIIGEYTITYNLYDENDELIETLIRNVNVIDVVPPVITLVASVDTVIIGEDYVDLGFIAIDNNSTNMVKVVVGTVDTSVIGNHTITYSVEDSSGNETTATRIVSVEALQSSIIFTFGEGTLGYIEGQTLDVPICTVNDIECIVDLTNVNMNVTGTYTVIYSITVNERKYSKEISIYVLASYDDPIIFEKKWGVEL